MSGLVHSKASMAFMQNLNRNLIVWTILYASPKACDYFNAVFVHLYNVKCTCIIVFVIGALNACKGMAIAVRQSRLPRVPQRVECGRDSALRILPALVARAAALSAQVAALLGVHRSLPDRHQRAHTAHSPPLYLLLSPHSPDSICQLGLFVYTWVLCLIIPWRSHLTRWVVVISAKLSLYMFTDLFRSQGEILAIFVALAHSLGRRPETLLQSLPPLNAFTWQSGLWVLFLLSYLPGTFECNSIYRQNTVYWQIK